MYQIFSAVNDIFLLLTYVGCVEGLQVCSGNQATSCDWYTKNYFLMFYAAYLSIPLCNVPFILSACLAVSMTIDRVFALSKPTMHMAIKHSRHQAVAFFCSFVIVLLTNVADGLQFGVGEAPGGGYKLLKNTEYTASNLAAATVYSRNIILFICVIGLIVFNSVLLQLYRKKQEKHIELTGKNPAKAAEVRAQQTTLVVLVTCQSVLLSISAMVSISHYMCKIYVPGYRACYGSVTSAWMNGMQMITDGPKFYVVFAVNANFRRATLEILKSFLAIFKRDMTVVQSVRNN